MTAREPRPVGITVLQTDGHQGAVVVAFDDQLAAHMKAEAFDHGLLGGIAGAATVVLLWFLAAVVATAWRALFPPRAAHSQDDVHAHDRALGVGGNP